MGIPSITTMLPEGSAAFVFGSYPLSACPSDLDILVVYDSQICNPKNAYGLHQYFLDALQSMASISIDVTLLTHEEAEESRFKEEVGVIAFDKIEQKITRRWREIGRSAGALPPTPQRNRYTARTQRE